MSANKVFLRFAPGSNWAYLREIRGSDEQSVEGAGTVEAIRLLDRLLVSTSGTDIGPDRAKELATPDRDRMLATIYISTYGSRVESVVNCSQCDSPFDADFSLEDLIHHVDSEAAQANIEEESSGVYKLPDGRCFRLPTGEDECATLGMSPEEAERFMLNRCILKGDPTEDAQDVQRAMRDIAPILDLDMDARCPECDHQQVVRFDIQYYLLYRLIQGQRQLSLEVHQLARAYGWGLSEILSLPRSVRKIYVQLVEAEMDAQRRRSSL
jgi:hypothetical protein